jgi:hypothetical protein
MAWGDSNNSVLAWWGDGNNSVSPEKLILVSALDSAQTVSLYFGNDQENYISVTVSSKYIQPGTELRSEDSSLSDGLDSSATWKKISYVSSSKHPTYTDLKIISINMAEKKAVVQIAAKLVNLGSDKYIEFENKSYEIRGESFDEFTHFQASEKEKITLTPEERDEIENSFGGALSAHQVRLEAAFKKFKPNNYQGFAQYKVKDWLPPLNHNQAIMASNWEKVGRPFMQPEYQNISKIISAMTDLNTVSIKMQSYLKNHKTTDLKLIEEKLSKISKLSAPYVEYQPKQNM